MRRPGQIVLIIVAALVLTGTTTADAAPTQPEKATGVVTPTPAAEQSEKQKQLAIATEAAKQLLLVIDTNKSGKISKEE